MSRMTTSLRELVLGERRDPACLFEWTSSCRRVYPPPTAVEASGSDQSERPRQDLAPTSSPRREPGAQLARGDRQSARARRRGRARGARAASSTASSALAREARAASRRRAARRRSTSSGSFQPRKSANSSAPTRKTGSSHSGCARSRSTVRACSSSTHLVVGERRARELEPDLGGRLDVLVPGLGGDEDEQPLEPELPPSRGARARRGRGAAGRTRRRRAPIVSASSKLSSPTSTSAPWRRAGGAQRALELLVGRRRADDAEAAVGAEQPPRPRLRLRPVDEEVGELVVGALRSARPRGTSANSARRNSSSPSPVAHESAEDGDHARVVDRRTRRLRLEVELVQHDDLRPLVEARAVRARARRRSSRHCSSASLRRVDHVDEHPRALEVREELVAEPDALARALDQARDVGDDELAPVGRLDRAEHRLQRRERVVGDLRPRVRDAREQRRLARVRQPDERRVGEQLQVQLDVALLARQADLREPRHLPRRRDEARVAAPAAAAAREHDPRAGMREVGDQVVAVEAPACRPGRAARRRRRRRRACARRGRCRRAAP